MRRRTTARDKAKAVTGEAEKPKPTLPSVKTEMPEGRPSLASKQVGDESLTRASAVKMTGFESIIDNVFTFDPDAAYKVVVESLELSQRASRADFGFLIDALDASEEVARLALQLVANAKVAAVRYQTDIEVIKSELHEQSVKEMLGRYEDPEDKGVTRKPTIADIEAYKVSTYHDEWADLEANTSKSKRTVDYLEGLSALAAQRARDLRQMVASSRGA